MRQRVAVLAAGLTLAAFPLVAGAQIVQNGSFETSPLNPGGGFLTISAVNTTDLPSWTVSGGNLDYIGGYWQAADGVRSLDMNGTTAATIFQDILLTAGSPYRLTFMMSGNGGGLKTMDVFVNAAAGPLGAAHPFSFTAGPGWSYQNMQWEARTLDFVAPASTTRITFQSTMGGSGGPALDAVAVAALRPPSNVPEPATVALLAGGLGVLGVAARRRRA